MYGFFFWTKDFVPIPSDAGEQINRHFFHPYLRAYTNISYKKKVINHVTAYRDHMRKVEIV